jgi:hypothetical protein
MALIKTSHVSQDAGLFVLVICYSPVEGTFGVLSLLGGLWSKSLFIKLRMMKMKLDMRI